MSNPTFPIRVPYEQARQIRQGDQQIVEDRQGLTGSHRRANKTDRRPEPAKTSLRQGNLRVIVIPTRYVLPTAFSTTSFGVPTPELDSVAYIAPTTVASGATLGTPTVAHRLAPTAVASTAALGSPVVTDNVRTAGATAWYSAEDG